MIVMFKNTLLYFLINVDNFSAKNIKIEVFLANEK